MLCRLTDFWMSWFFLAASLRRDMVEDDLVTLAEGLCDPWTDAVLDWPRPVARPRVDDVTLWTWPTFADWPSSAGGPASSFRRSRGFGVTLTKPVRGRLRASNDSRLLSSVAGAVAAAAVSLLAAGFEPPFINLAILDVRDAVKPESPLSFGAWLFAPCSERLARLEAVAFISELRRDVDTDLAVSAFLLRPASVLLTPLLPAGPSPTDVSAPGWPTADVFDGRTGPSDCRLAILLAAVGTLWSRPFWCCLEVVTALWPYSGVSVLATEPRTFSVPPVSCSLSRSRDFEAAATAEEDATAGRSRWCSSSCLCNSGSVAAGCWRWLLGRWSSSRAVVVVHCWGAAVAFSRRGLVGGGAGAS